MQAFYINLDNADVRRSIIEEQIKTSHLLFEINRFSAIQGSLVPRDNNLISNGQWGCWLSHIDIIEKNLNVDDHLLIIEDDETFSDLLNHSITLTESLQDSDWDLLYLDQTFVEIEDFLLISREIDSLIRKNLAPYTLKLPRTSTPYGTHAYIINKNKKLKVLSLLKNNINCGLPIDNVYCAALQEGKLNSFISIPSLMMPGAQTKQSQINPETHPLEVSWINFRELISIEKITKNIIEYNDEKHILNNTKEAILNRLNFNILLKFNPFQGRNIKLK